MNLKEAKEILDFTKDWLNSNITDELQPEAVKLDSQDLLNKIEVMENESKTS